MRSNVRDLSLEGAAPRCHLAPSPPPPGDVDGAHDEAYSEDDKDDDYADHANDGVKLRHEFWVDQSIS